MLHNGKMVNDLKVITDRLEGFSSDTIAFDCASAFTDANCRIWTLELQSYCKTEDRALTAEEHFKELSTIVDRLKGWGDDRYEVIYAENKGYGEWLIKCTYFEEGSNEEKDSKEA